MCPRPQVIDDGLGGSEEIVSMREEPAMNTDIRLDKTCIIGAIPGGHGYFFPKEEKGEMRVVGDLDYRAALGETEPCRPERRPHSLEPIALFSELRKQMTIGIIEPSP